MEEEIKEIKEILYDINITTKLKEQIDKVKINTLIFSNILLSVIIFWKKNT